MSRDPFRNQVFAVSSRPARREVPSSIHRGVPFRYRTFSARDAAAHAKCGRSFFHRIDVPRAPDGRCQSKTDNLILLTAPETCHQKNARLEPASRSGIASSSDVTPARGSLCLQCTRTFHGSMAIGVGFHHCTDGHAAPICFCTVRKFCRKADRDTIAISAVAMRLRVSAVVATSPRL